MSITKSRWLKAPEDSIYMPSESFQYRRMSFGLTNAPAMFQRLMATLFAGKEWSFVFVYLDNLLIVSISIAEHVEHLR